MVGKPYTTSANGPSCLSVVQQPRSFLSHDCVDTSLVADLELRHTRTRQGGGCAVAWHASASISTLLGSVRALSIWQTVRVRQAGQSLDDPSFSRSLVPNVLPEQPSAVFGD